MPFFYTWVKDDIWQVRWYDARQRPHQDWLLGKIQGSGKRWTIVLGHNKGAVFPSRIAAAQALLPPRKDPG